jgi:hypothetical protein
MSECRAKVRWLSFEEGGRVRPPTGPRYSATARFTTAAPPAELFVRGSRFVLLEGEVQVGEGEIV